MREKFQEIATASMAKEFTPSLMVTATREGEFKDDTFNGNGVKADADCSRYKGEFKDGKFHGKEVKNLREWQPIGRKLG